MLLLIPGIYVVLSKLPLVAYTLTCGRFLYFTPYTVLKFGVSETSVMQGVGLLIIYNFVLDFRVLRPI
jgi:hypothetical protein